MGQQDRGDQLQGRCLAGFGIGDRLPGLRFRAGRICDAGLVAVAAADMTHFQIVEAGDRPLVQFEFRFAVCHGLSGLKLPTLFRVFGFPREREPFQGI